MIQEVCGQIARTRWLSGVDVKEVHELIIKHSWITYGSGIEVDVIYRRLCVQRYNLADHEGGVV